MDDYFFETLNEIIYAFEKILKAVKSQNLNAIDWIANQEIKAIKHDLNLLRKEDKK